MASATISSLLADANSQDQRRAQQTSTLLALPTELRSMILENFFQSITVRQGFEGTNTRNTAILRVCRQLFSEALPLLPSVSFHFRSPVVMLDTLLPLPRETLEQIRHVRLKSF